MSSKASQSTPIPSTSPSNNKITSVRRATGTRDSDRLAQKSSTLKQKGQKQSATVSPSRQTHRPSRPVSPGKPASPNKQSRLIELMHQPAGASLADLMKATGWQAHSVRGVISAVLRKRLGLAVICQTDQDGKRIYRIQPSTTAIDDGEMAQ